MHTWLHLPQVIFCTAARTTLTGDLTRVEVQGVSNVTRALEVSPARVSVQTSLSA